MGKKSRRPKKALPFVSICTPTYNRRPFIKSAISCYLHQDYPNELMEWIIIDDGTDKIEDLVKDIRGVKYFSYDEKMSLGKKRNIMHSKCKGEIIVYQDDDDYYPIDRVSHAVHTLMKNPTALVAGSSEIYIWFKHIQTMYQFGPYNPNHATAGTFALRRKVLDITSYDETACLAEERHFLKDYKIPLVQLNPMKTILVISHEHNTFDKKKLLEGNPDPTYVKPSRRKVKDFIKEEELYTFFMNDINDLIKDYDPGRPEMKPDVLRQLKKMEEERQASKNNQTINIEYSDGTTKTLTISEIVEIMNNNQKQILDMKEHINKCESFIQNYKPTIKCNNGDELPINLFVEKANEAFSQVDFLTKRLENFNPDIKITCEGKDSYIDMNTLVDEYHMLICMHGRPVLDQTEIIVNSEKVLETSIEIPEESVESETTIKDDNIIDSV